MEDEIRALLENQSWEVMELRKESISMQMGLQNQA